MLDLQQEITAQERRNLDINNWIWRKKESDWSEAPLHWQQLYEKCLREGDIQQNPGDWLNFLEERVMILEPYLETFKEIWKLALSTPEAGTLITGQPGIGKSYFLKYMLICLLRKRQPAIIIDTDSIILFWLDGKAWMTRGTGDYPWPKEILNLPITPQSPPKAPEHGFIWALIDVDRSSDLAAARLFNYPMFPIQSASPDPKHYRRWMKQRYLAVPRTLPLWTKEKLLQLLQVHDSFGRLDSLTQTALERGEQATGMGLVWEDHLFTVLKTVPIPFTTKNEAYSFLADYAIYHYGFVARDFLSFFFDPFVLKEQHKQTLDSLTFMDVERIIKEFQREKTLAASSDRLITVFPSSDDQSRGISWGVDFRSSHTAKTVIEKLRYLQDAEIVKLYRSLCSIPCTAVIAGWFFEPIAVRRLAHNSGSLILEEVCMVTDEDGLSHTTSLASVQPTDVKLPRSSSLDGFPVHLYNQIALKKLALNTFYSPDAQNNPLWDLLLITQESDVYVIWVFQMTTASDHKRLREGYISIRRIMTEFEQQNSQGQRLSFEVRYVLVSPDDGVPREWNMPSGWAAGWDEHTTRHNHQGSCYLVRIPIPDGSADCTAQ